MALLESVPNVSEGCDPAVIEAVADAFAGRARVLDVHSDPEHHRSVYTIVAEESELAAALFAGIARAAELIDLREHVGIHPRVGAADVVPIVPLARRADAACAARLRSSSARASATSSGCRCSSTARAPTGCGPPSSARGGPAELQRRIDSGELVPSFGPATLDPRAGAVLIGARPLLIAFNIELRTGDLEDAQAIAAAVRGVEWWHARRAGARAAAPGERAWCRCRST